MDEKNKESECGVCGYHPFDRNNYFYGKLLTVRDLFLEQRYFNEKRWLINRAVLGWGVVCGLDVTWHKDKRHLVVSNGLAIDCCGREILVCEDQCVGLDDLIGRCSDQWKPGTEEELVLCIEYRKCRTEVVHLPPVACDDKERTEYNRIRDDFAIRVKRPEEVCPEQPYGNVACLDRFKSEQERPPGPDRCRTGTIHEYLCKHLKENCPECKCCECVVLARVKVKWIPDGQDPTKREVAVTVDCCTDRRLVYRNPLLYDLIYCHHGDLPHIVDFSWRVYSKGGTPIYWKQFLKMMEEPFKVVFDQKMEDATLNRHTFILSYLWYETGIGHQISVRIPGKIQVGMENGCYTASFIPDPGWITDEVTGPNSRLKDLLRLGKSIDFEVTIRGSRIKSCEGKALDGEYLYDKLPTGNGVQGGDFIDFFTISPGPSTATQQPGMTGEY